MKETIGGRDEPHGLERLVHRGCASGPCCHCRISCSTLIQPTERAEVPRCPQHDRFIAAHGCGIRPNQCEPARFQRREQALADGIEIFITPPRAQSDDCLHTDPGLEATPPQIVTRGRISRWCENAIEAAAAPLCCLAPPRTEVWVFLFR